MIKNIDSRLKRASEQVNKIDASNIKIIESIESISKEQIIYIFKICNKCKVIKEYKTNIDNYTEVKNHLAKQYDKAEFIADYSSLSDDELNYLIGGDRDKSFYYDIGTAFTDLINREVQYE